MTTLVTEAPYLNRRLIHGVQYRYESERAQLMSRDPIGSRESVNLYAFVYGNSVNVMDPTGEIPVMAVIKIVNMLINCGLAGYTAYLFHDCLNY